MVIVVYDEYIVVLCGIGKLEGIDVCFIFRNVWEMFGLLGGMIFFSYVKVWGNIFLVICKVFVEWGYI